jgi:N-acetylneuraminic acid mutarotase
MSRLAPSQPLLIFGLVALAACGESSNPTQPNTEAAPAAPSLAVAAGSWTNKAPYPFSQVFNYDLGMALNSAGESVVYAFGGQEDEGVPGVAVQAYDVATDTWTGRTSRVAVYKTNGVGKIGSKLYFSGGYNTVGSLPDATARVWAYDYGRDQLIRKADLPIVSAEGVSGVISGKLYVLPGACNGNNYPQPGYCAEEATRRFYRYDPATNTWVSRPQAPHFHRNGAATVIDGKFYVTGGRDASGDFVTALDVYDPATNTWTTRAPIPADGGGEGAALQGQFYVVGSHTYAYNRTTNQWKARPAPDIGGPAATVVLSGLARIFVASSNDHSAMYTP